MKKALVVFMLVLLPLQAFAAMERGLAHLLGVGGGPQVFAKHLVEHEVHIPHHHDDDVDGAIGAPHDGDSAKSLQHLADFEQHHAGGIALPASETLILVTVARLAPDVRFNVYANRTTLPLLRPPRRPA